MYTHLPSEFDRFPYRVMKEEKHQGQAIAGFVCSVFADQHCMDLNRTNTEEGVHYALEMCEVRYVNAAVEHSIMRLHHDDPEAFERCMNAPEAIPGMRRAMYEFAILAES